MLPKGTPRQGGARDDDDDRSFPKLRVSAVEVENRTIGNTNAVVMSRAIVAEALPHEAWQYLTLLNQSSSPSSLPSSSLGS